MASENIIKRSDILNTKVITDDNAKVLGVVSQLWVDIDRREVVALGLRDNLIAFAGVPRYLYLSSIRKIGDVILVDNEDVIEDIDPDAYSSVINSEVITETGDLLGRVRGFTFDGETGKLYSLIIAALGLPQIPEQLLSTYELPIEEIVSSGPNRLIVFEGAEERVNQLTVGLLERLGIGKAPWEREEEEYYTPTTIRPENQLSSGVPLQTPPRTRTQSLRARETVVQETWDEDDWEEQAPQPLPQPLRQRQYETVQYEEDLEDENWSEASRADRYPAQARYIEPEPYTPEPYEPQPFKQPTEEYADYELEGDAWDDEPAKPVNIPKKTKQPEYEEEDQY